MRSFEELVRRNQQAVRNWLRQLGRNSALAEDLAQETFIHAWEKIGTYRFDGEFRSWLFSIAYRQFLLAARNSKRDRSLLEKFKILVTETQSASEAVVYEANDLPKFLAILSEEEKACMILGHGFAFSNAEISRITQLPLGTVKSHIRRGAMKIQNEFDFKG